MFAKNKGMKKLFLNVNEVSEYLGVETSTIYSWIHIRQIPYYKVGRLVKFKVDEIEDWLISRKRKVVNLEA